MKRTTSLLLGLALMGTTIGCYCMPYNGAGGGMGFPLGCPPSQMAPMMPTPTPVPSSGFNTIEGAPIATPVTVLPAPMITTPVVIESLPTFR